MDVTDGCEMHGQPIRRRLPVTEGRGDGDLIEHVTSRRTRGDHWQARKVSLPFEGLMLLCSSSAFGPCVQIWLVSGSCPIPS